MSATQNLAEPVSREISPRDEQFLFALCGMKNDEPATRAYYFDSGRAHAEALVRYLTEAGRDAKSLDLLDYAAGYGRVTRWLAPAFRSVTAADVEADMIGF